MRKYFKTIYLIKGFSPSIKIIEMFYSYDLLKPKLKQTCVTEVNKIGELRFLFAWN